MEMHSTDRFMPRKIATPMAPSSVPDMPERTRHNGLSLILAFDVGTSYLKAAIFDRGGSTVARADMQYTTVMPSPGRVEQAPDEWLDLMCAAVRQMRNGGIDTGLVVGIGLSARGANTIFLDDAGEVLTPCWLDHRCAPAARQLAVILGRDIDYQTRRMASHTYHLRTEHPDLFDRLAHPLFAKDFVLFRLTGRLATDPSSGPPEGIWPADLWNVVGVPIERLPPVFPHTTVAGTLLPSMADRLGLPPGIPVGVGGHDGACANTGAGAIVAGQCCLTLGTQGVARTITDRVPPDARDRRVSPYHFLPGRWCCSGDLIKAGAIPTLTARTLLGDEVPLAQAHAKLTHAAQPVAPGSGGVTYLPFPGGEICPDLRLDARAAYLGMSTDTGRAELYRATLEGTAYAFRSAVERHREVGLTVDDIRLSGGGAANMLWVRILSDVLQSPMTVVAPDEGTRGAAMFLATGLGWFASVEDAAAAWVRTVEVIPPGPDSAIYDVLYRRFRHLADAVYEAERTVPA